MALFTAALSLRTPCIVSHAARGACGAAVERVTRGTEEERRGWDGRIKHYLTDGSRDALPEVNYQLLQGE